MHQYEYEDAVNNLEIFESILFTIKQEHNSDLFNNEDLSDFNMFFVEYLDDLPLIKNELTIIKDNYVSIYQHLNKVGFDMLMEFVHTEMKQALKAIYR